MTHFSMTRYPLGRQLVQLWQELDWFLILLIMGLNALGGLMIHSTQLYGGYSDYGWQHCLLGGLGVIFVVAIARWPYEQLLQWHWVIYGLVNLSLIAVKVIGTEALGAQRWISIGGFHVQPSEFAKLGIIITLAALLHQQSAAHLSNLVRVLMVTAVPWLLVFLQPDLGTSLVFGAITLGMLYWGNAHPGWLLLMISPLVSAVLFGLGVTQLGVADVPAPAGWQPDTWLSGSIAINLFLLVWLGWVALMGLMAWRSLPWPWVGSLGALVVNLLAGEVGQLLWSILKDYQKDRLILFLDPDKDPLGGGYHLIQSRIAIGAGELWGRGLHQGTQTQLGFIPEQHTDFIFSAVGEELGLVGCLAVLVSFWLISLRIILIAQGSKDDFGSLLTIGMLSMVVFQVSVNIGMTIGLAPVTGIPLPWVSYGRSALLTNYLALGLVQSVARSRRLRAKGGRLYE